MTTNRALVPLVGTCLLGSVTLLSVLGLLKGAGAEPPMATAGLAVLGFTAVAGVGGILGLWLPRSHRAG